MSKVEKLSNIKQNEVGKWENTNTFNNHAG